MFNSQFSFPMFAQILQSCLTLMSHDDDGNVAIYIQWSMYYVFVDVYMKFIRVSLLLVRYYMDIA